MSDIDSRGLDGLHNVNINTRRTLKMGKLWTDGLQTAGADPNIEEILPSFDEVIESLAKLREMLIGLAK